MIKTEKLTPEVYYKRSRDFQLLGRTFDVIFNYIKLNSEILYNSPLSENFDNKLIDLTSTTLGFKKIHEYNVKQLSGLCSIFAEALRNKGNIQSITNLLNLIGNVQNTTSKFTCVREEDDPYVLDIFVPATIADTNLIEDVLNYILPAGMSYKILKQALLNAEPFTETYYFNDMEQTKVTVKHVLQNSQVLQIENDTPKPQRSDTEVGRIDNTMLADITNTDNTGTADSDHSAEILAEYVKEKQYENGSETVDPVYKTEIPVEDDE